LEVRTKSGKLERQKRDIQSLIIAAYQSGADADVVMIRVSDLQWDMDILDKEIEEEKIFLGFKWGLAIFLASMVGLIIVTLIYK
jgi:hypothetical protein